MKLHITMRTDAPTNLRLQRNFRATGETFTTSPPMFESHSLLTESPPGCQTNLACCLTDSPIIFRREQCARFRGIDYGDCRRSTADSCRAERSRDRFGIERSRHQYAAVDQFTLRRQADRPRAR